ncbi:GntR family transcriptional regulator [Achromobacter denitrificans]|uniref:GntR family transcriptional regulator n=1 Tax=Achromobacter denitrificans TaxID=32002 RepID=UPI000B4C95F9|nr:GntR family transcriptional regulator [Achromobacter denitrificans]ASC66473.1 GntR family transcriptional regulator [Achromobacter denitrificans]
MLQFQKTAISAEDEAYLHLQREIRLGRYAPGQRLVPEVVAAEIGTSRMPVRGALRRLASEGLVEIRANRGAVVRGLNQQEMLEVFEMRSVLEGLAMRNAVLNMNAEHIRRLSNSLELLEQGPGEDLDWTTAHREFHEYLCSFCQQPRLLRQLSELHSVVEPYMRLWATQPGRVLRVRESHQELIDALRTRDPARCEAAMRQHVLNTVPALQAFLEQAA